MTESDNPQTGLPHDITRAGVTVHIPTRHEIDPHLKPGAAFDIDAGDMPEDGVVAINDSDDALLDEEKQHPISDIPVTGA